MKNKSIEVKDMAKNAKKRLRTGFWEENGSEVATRCESLIKNGFSDKEVLAAFDKNATKRTLKTDKTEIFYRKVKSILDKCGEVGNIISMLIDKKLYVSLSYEAKQKYMLDLSENYRVALARYRKEKMLKNNI